MKRQLKAWAAQGAAIRFAPYKARRNSFAGLVRLPRRVQDERSGSGGGRRGSQRCLAQSDSRRTL